jgi:hypothetical protein
MLSRPQSIESDQHTVTDRTQTPSGPSMLLPKGGGAIRGIGEELAANPFTGTGSLAIPFFTSPEGSAFAPKLSLSRDSGAGNGPFGFGWLFSLLQIALKPDQRPPQSNNVDGSYVFLLSDVEDLMPLPNPDGNRFKNIKTAPDYIIHRYHPCLECLFARIDCRPPPSNGDVLTHSISPNHVLTLYGKDQNSRKPRPRWSSRIFTSRDDGYKGELLLSHTGLPSQKRHTIQGSTLSIELPTTARRWGGLRSILGE